MSTTRVFYPAAVALDGLPGDAAGPLDGDSLIPLAQIPPAAQIVRVTVANEGARLALTTAEVQDGDYVYQTDTAAFYLVVDDSQLNGAGGYQQVVLAAELAAHIADTTAAHAASAIAATPSGNLAGDTVEEQLQELDAEKPDISGTPSAGNYARWADADTLEARTTAQVLSDIGAPNISGTPSAGNYARWSDANTLEARTTAQVLSDIGAPDITGTPVAGQLATWSDANTLQGLSGVYLAHLSHAAYTNGELITLPFAASGGAADGEYYIRVVRRAVGGTTGSAQDISFAIAADVVSGTPYTSSMGPSTPFIVRIAISGGYVCLHLANTSAADLYLQVFTNADSPAGAFSISDVASTGTAATSQNSSADTVAIEAETLFRSRADSTRWYVQGGIGAGKDYGSYIELNANTGPRTGSLLLASGDVANGAIILRSGNNLDCLTINRDGTVTLHATTLADLRDQVIRTGHYAVAWTATPATGYLNADGSAVSRATYAALFAVIGTTFGVGDGSTTFNLPDASGLNTNDIYLHIKT